MDESTEFVWGMQQPAISPDNDICPSWTFRTVIMRRSSIDTSTYRLKVRLVKWSIYCGRSTPRPSALCQSPSEHCHLDPGPRKQLVPGHFSFGGKWHLKGLPDPQEELGNDLLLCATAGSTAERMVEILTAHLARHNFLNSMNNDFLKKILKAE